MIKTICAVAAFMVLFSVSAGHAQMQQSRLELDYGTSVKLAKINQILNPDADRNLEPVYGLNGNAAQENIKKYVRSFEIPAKEPVYTFTIGGSK